MALGRRKVSLSVEKTFSFLGHGEQSTQCPGSGGFGSRVGAGRLLQGRWKHQQKIRQSAHGRGINTGAMDNNTRPNKRLGRNIPDKISVSKTWWQHIYNSPNKGRAAETDYFAGEIRAENLPAVVKNLVHHCRRNNSSWGTVQTHTTPSEEEQINNREPSCSDRRHIGFEVKAGT